MNALLRKSHRVAGRGGAVRTAAKTAAVLACFYAARFWIRRVPFPGGKLRLWDFCRRYINWRDLQVTARYARGMRTRCALNDLVQCYLAYFGAWEPNLTAFIRRRLRPGDVFVDVGANVGYFSLLASRLVDATGQVIAVEASPRIYAALCQNIALSRVTNVRPVNRAASDKPGLLRLYAGPRGNIGMTSTIPSHATVFEADVRAEPLDTMLSADELRRVRLVKIDIEGGELAVLDRLLQRIDLLPVTAEIAVELTPRLIAAQGGSVADLLDRFANAGFHAYSLPNTYSVREYIASGQRATPRRLTAIPEAQVDVILSREAGEAL